MNNSPQWYTATLVHTEDLSPSIRLFELAVEGGARAWTPGAHIQVRVVVDGREELRHYSLIELGRNDGSYRIAVKKIESGMGGSRYMWSLQAGDSLVISAPRNQFELGFTAPACTLVAGGVGITPIVSMAHFLATQGKAVRLYYAVRSEAEAVFAQALRQWLGERLELYISDLGQRMDLNAIAASTPKDAELYVCGPITMLEAARSAWQKAGRSLGQLRYETFASSGHYANAPFTVSIPRLGLTLDVPAHQTLLAALEHAGVDVMADCRRGECGLCALDVLGCDAPIDHRDVFLSEKQKAENRSLCACVSRPAHGHLRIDTAYRGSRRQAA
ncbi:PDR/VanB family oxidoreductase [Uliginosibacterium sediminicola]|uniref:PDR/VanB family oxidoreductase n=1 Tax=Uliginosibacterium sediminicola TaxID=2024550 RepID=A0ABU9Z082_9RHOO